MEIEVRSYMDECNRLRVQLEEVIRSKDTFADPEELKLIEDRFSPDSLIGEIKAKGLEFEGIICRRVTGGLKA